MSEDYVAANGSGYTDDDMKVIVPVLKKLEKRYEILRPEHVLEEAKKKRSPLHRFFEWDDSEAANRWRIWQARHIIQNIKIVPNNTPPVRLMVNVQHSDGRRGYVSTEKASKIPNYKEQMLDSALRDLAALQAKYSNLKAFVQAVDQLIIKLRDSSISARS